MPPVWPVAVDLAGPTGSTGPAEPFSFSGETGAILYSPDGTNVTGSSKLVYKDSYLESHMGLLGGMLLLDMDLMREIILYIKQVPMELHGLAEQALFQDI